MTTDNVRGWEEISHSLDGMIAVAQHENLTTQELAFVLLDSLANGERSPEMMLTMMSLAFATAVQRLAGYEPVKEIPNDDY